MALEEQKELASEATLQSSGHSVSVNGSSERLFLRCLGKDLCGINYQQKLNSGEAPRVTFCHAFGVPCL